MNKSLTQQEEIWNLISEIRDPEIPVISISELGILREVKVDEGQVSVFITPTYTECPAIDFFKKEITMRLQINGYENVEVNTIYSPAWTSNWIDIVGKEKLRQSGIAPPVKKCAGNCTSTKCKTKVIRCPHCRSRATQLVAEIGSTVCKSIYNCEDCSKSFEYFKSV